MHREIYFIILFLLALPAACMLGEPPTHSLVEDAGVADASADASDASDAGTLPDADTTIQLHPIRLECEELDAFTEVRSTDTNGNVSRQRYVTLGAAVPAGFTGRLVAQLCFPSAPGATGYPGHDNETQPTCTTFGDSNCVAYGEHTTPCVSARVLTRNDGALFIKCGWRGYHFSYSLNEWVLDYTHNDQLWSGSPTEYVLLW